MGVNSLPKTVTRQRRGCNLNPGPTAPESSTLTTYSATEPPVNSARKCYYLLSPAQCSAKEYVICKSWRGRNTLGRHDLKKLEGSRPAGSVVASERAKCVAGCVFGSDGNQLTTSSYS